MVFEAFQSQRFSTDSPHHSPTDVVSNSQGTLQTERNQQAETSNTLLQKSIKSLEQPHLVYFGRKAGNRVEWTNTAETNICKISGLPTWSNEYRLAYLNNFETKVLKERQPFLTIEIDMRLLKLFNDRYGQDTADKALRQFTRALREQLDKWVKDYPDSEYYLYKMHEGGDDYSLGVTGPIELLFKIQNELGLFLDNNNKPEPNEDLLFTEKNVKGQSQSTRLSAECGTSLIGEGENVVEALPMLQEKYKYPVEKRRDPTQISGTDLQHDLVETYKHIANLELVKSKASQIFVELEAGDDAVREALISIRNLIKDEVYGADFDTKIQGLLNPPPEQLSRSEIYTKMDEIRLTISASMKELLRIRVPEGITETFARAEWVEVKNREIQNASANFEKVFGSLSSIFGERRKSAAGEYYTANLVRICERIQFSIKKRVPLSVPLLTFLGIMEPSTQGNLTAYVSALIKQDYKLSPLRKEVLGQSLEPHLEELTDIIYN
jgi:GGDEF domain-containing protein